MASAPFPNVGEHAVALATRGLVDDGYRLLNQAIAGGDGLAAASLAQWRLTGQFIRRDLAEARRLYGQAAKLGITAANAPYLAMLASGAGGSSRDWGGALKLLRQRQLSDPAARAQLAILDAMELSEHGEPTASWDRRPLRAEPLINHVPAFLSAAECDYLRRIAMPALTPALIVDPQTGALRPDPVRRARSAAFPIVAEDPVLHAINRRIAHVTGTLWEQGEPTQVLAYGPGEEYRLHSDALPGGDNQRVMTFLVALNADYEGGETHFPAAGLAWRGQTGDALVFRNVDAAGRPSEAARHAGGPVRRGAKFILSRWIRAQPLDLTGPPGRPF